MMGASHPEGDGHGNGIFGWPRAALRATAEQPLDGDQELLRRYRDQHDMQAFEALVRRRGPTVSDVAITLSSPYKPRAEMP